jgi:hypothetical protein
MTRSAAQQHPVTEPLCQEPWALEAGIRDWIQNWNQNPLPFTWTKTAEQILESLARYIAKISGAAY